MDNKDEQKPVRDFLHKLFLHGAEAARWANNFPGTKEEEIALENFIKCIETIPEEIRDNPAIVEKPLFQKFFAKGLVAISIQYGALDPKGIAEATGHALSCVGEKHPEVLGFAMDFLRRAIVGGKQWGDDHGAAAETVRTLALEIFRSTIKLSWDSDKSEWAGPGWAFTVTAAGILPFYADAEMVVQLISELNYSKTASVTKLAATHSVVARETLEEMIILDPCLSKQATIALESSKKIVDIFALPEMLPVAMAAAEHTRRSINKAVKRSAKKTARSADGLMKENYSGASLDILAL